MKKVWLSLGVLALIIASGCGGSGASDPLGSNNSSGGGAGAGNGNSCASPTLSLLSNGVLGTFMGYPLVAETGSTGSINAVAIPDPISGLGTTTQVSIACSNPPSCTNFPSTGWLRLTVCPVSSTHCASTNIPPCYISRGTVDFNLKIDVPLAQIAGAQVYWGNTGCYASATFIPVSQLSNSFLHYSLPLSSFSGGGNCVGGRSVPFQINLSQAGSSNSGLLFTVSDVKWVGH